MKNDSERAVTSLPNVLKRDGTTVSFDEEKIVAAIFKAAQAVGGKDETLARQLAKSVIVRLEAAFQGETSPSVEEIQDYVEKVLIEAGHARTAKAYILYRERHRHLRAAKGLLGTQDEMKLSLPALRLFESRYLRRDEDRKVVETPSQLLLRVAKHIATADSFYLAHGNREATEAAFYHVMRDLKFLPHPAVLLHAGTELTHLAGFFSLPLEDQLESIFDMMKQVTLLTRGEVILNVDFSSLRPKGDGVGQLAQPAVGPLSFFKLFQEASQVVTARAGRQLGLLMVDHPDILDFLTELPASSAFLPALGLTEAFLTAAQQGGKFDLIHPIKKQRVGELPARQIFDLITMALWRQRVPAISFRPFSKKIGFGSSHVGMIFLNQFVVPQGEKYRLDFDELKRVIHLAIHFLDNCVDLSHYAQPSLNEAVRMDRPLGLALSGFADLMLWLGVPYGSETSKEIARQLLEVVEQEAMLASAQLAEQRGSLPNSKVRNRFQTAFFYVETLAMLAGSSPGFSPLPYLVRKESGNALGSAFSIHPALERLLQDMGCHDPLVLERLAQGIPWEAIPELPPALASVFVTIHHVSPHDQLEMMREVVSRVDLPFPQPIWIAPNTPPDKIGDVLWQAYEKRLPGFWLET